MILVTGGLGYIGSHLCIELLNKHDVIILDDLSNSCETTLHKIKHLSKKSPIFFSGSVNDTQILTNILTLYKVTHIIHLTGSNIKNIDNVDIFIDTAYKYGVKNFIIGSSAAVYGEHDSVRISENFDLRPINDVGSTYTLIEHIMIEYSISKPDDINIAFLRLFNVIGTHSSGILYRIPDTARSIIDNIVLNVKQEKKYFSVHGNHYLTNDGTCVRDYVDIRDVISAIELSIEHNDGVNVYNIGSGRGYSVYEVVDVVNNLGYNINIKVGHDRVGDVSYLCADISQAQINLNWVPQYTINSSINSILKHL